MKDERKGIAAAEKGLGQDIAGLALAGVGGIFAVCVCLDWMADMTPKAGARVLFAPVVGGIDLLGAIPTLALALGTAYLGSRMFLVRRRMEGLRQLLGLVAAALGVSLVAGGFGAGGAVGDALPAALPGLAGMALTLAAGVVVFGASLWLTWGAPAERVAAVANAESEFLADTQANIEGVSAAEAAALAPVEDRWSGFTSPSAPLEGDVRAAGGIPAGAEPLDPDRGFVHFGAASEASSDASVRPYGEPSVPESADLAAIDEEPAGGVFDDPGMATYESSSDRGSPASYLDVEEAAADLPTVLPSWESEAAEDATPEPDGASEWVLEDVAPAPEVASELAEELADPELEDEPESALEQEVALAPELAPAVEEEPEPSTSEVEEELEVATADAQELALEEEPEVDAPASDGSFSFKSWEQPALFEELDEPDTTAELEDEEEEEDDTVHGEDEEDEDEEEEEEELEKDELEAHAEDGEEEEDDEEEYEDEEEELVHAEDEEEDEEEYEEEEEEEEQEGLVHAEDEEEEEEDDEEEELEEEVEEDEPAPALATSDASEDEAEYVLQPAVAAAGGEVDEQLLHAAGQLILEQNRVAVSLIQRHFELDFDQACAVLDKLQERGLIGPYVGGRTREILLSHEAWMATAPPA